MAKKEIKVLVFCICTNALVCPVCIRKAEVPKDFVEKFEARGKLCSKCIANGCTAKQDKINKRTSRTKGNMSLRAKIIVSFMNTWFFALSTPTTKAAKARANKKAQA